MDYSTKAINSSKERIEPVFVTDELSGEQLDVSTPERFRIILFTEGQFSAEINGKQLQVISPAVICLNEKDTISLHEEDWALVKCRTFLFAPRFLNKKLNFENILQKGSSAESEVIENRMLLKTFIDSSILNYLRYINPEDRQHIQNLMDKAQF